jgi:hypothetical protein
METDEIFLLLRGNAVLLMGGIGKRPRDRIKAVRMAANKVYNVRKASWHAVLMKKGAKIFIVENRNTSRSNSEYSGLNPVQLGSLRKYRNY